MNVKIE